MIIKLNTELVESPNRSYSYDIKTMLERELNPYRREKYTAMYKAIGDVPESTLREPGLVGLLSDAYSFHRKVAIAPQDVWMLLISEIAIEVKGQPDLYRELFTDSDSKKELSVASGSMIEIPMDALSDLLGKNVNFDMSCLFPKFTTSTEITDEMTQALFCDMASPYYSYSMFCCGIPEIKLLGTADDWEQLLASWMQLGAVFSRYNESLVPYFVRVEDIIGAFIDEFIEEDGNTAFWKDIFTQKNVGSGGDLVIDGWISSLFIKNHGLKKIDNYTTTNAIVKYEQKQTGRKFAAVYGGYHHVRDDDGFIRLEYSKYIFEELPV